MRKRDAHNASSQLLQSFLDFSFRASPEPAQILFGIGGIEPPDFGKSNAEVCGSQIGGLFVRVGRKDSLLGQILYVTQ